MNPQSNSSAMEQDNLTLDIRARLGDILHEITFTHDTRHQKDENLVCFRIVVQVFIMGFLFLAGTAGNVLAIVVLRKDKKQNSTTWLLQVLAVLDSLCLLGSLFNLTFPTVQHDTTWWSYSHEWYPYIEVYLWPCASIFLTAAIWMVLLVTIDRYIAVSRPLQARAQSLTRVKVLAMMVCLAAVVYNIPRFLEREVTMSDGRPKHTTTELRKNPRYIIIYVLICHCTFRTVGPILVLLVLNIGLVRNLRKAWETQTQLGCTAAPSHHNVSHMLVAVVSVSLVCLLPDMVLRVVYTIYTIMSGSHISRNVMKYMNVVTNTLLVLNSAVNCLIYCFTGQKFRKDLKELVCGNC